MTKKSKYDNSLLDFMEQTMSEEKNTSSTEYNSKYTYEVQSSSSETLKKVKQERKKTTRKAHSNELVRIGEVAEMFKLNTSVLRFWEEEFIELNPTRTKTGQRLYSASDVALIKKLKKLLHEEGLTIEGAKKSLRKSPLPKGLKKLRVSSDVPVLSLYPEGKNVQENIQTKEENISSDTSLDFSLKDKKNSQKILRQVESQLLELQELLSI